MGNETEHVFVTEFPSAAVSKVSKAILTKEFSIALAFPIIKIVEFGLSLVASDGLSATADDGFEFTEEQVGHLLADASETHEGFAAGLEDAKALPWKSIFKVLLAILSGLIANPASDDTSDHPPA